MNEIIKHRATRLAQLETALMCKPSLIQENARLTVELASAKAALASILEVVGIYAEQEAHKPFSPEQWERMNRAMDASKAVLHR